MTRRNGDSDRIRIYRLPGWAVPLVAVLGLAVFLFAGLVSLTLLVFLIPVLLVVMLVSGLFQRLFGWGGLGPRTAGEETGRDDDRDPYFGWRKPQRGDTIEVDYEVIDPDGKRHLHSAGRGKDDDRAR